MLRLRVGKAVMIKDVFRTGDEAAEHASKLPTSIVSSRSGGGGGGGGDDGSSGGGGVIVVKNFPHFRRGFDFDGNAFGHHSVVVVVISSSSSSSASPSSAVFSSLSQSVFQVSFVQMGDQIVQLGVRFRAKPDI